MAILPVISGKEAIKTFEKAGWCVERRAKSGHIIMKKEGLKTLLSVPDHKVLIALRFLSQGALPWGLCPINMRAGKPANPTPRVRYPRRS